MQHEKHWVDGDDFMSTSASNLPLRMQPRTQFAFVAEAELCWVLSNSCLPRAPGALHPRFSPGTQTPACTGLFYSSVLTQMQKFTVTFFQSSWTFPGLQHCSNITVSGSVTVSATSPNSLGCILSGHTDLCGLKPCKKLKTTPSSSTAGLTCAVSPSWSCRLHLCH